MIDNTYRLKVVCVCTGSLKQEKMVCIKRYWILLGRRHSSSACWKKMCCYIYRIIATVVLIYRLFRISKKYVSGTKRLFFSVFFQILCF